MLRHRRLSAVPTCSFSDMKNHRLRADRPLFPCMLRCIPMAPIYRKTTGFSRMSALLTHKYAALPASCARSAEKRTLCISPSGKSTCISHEAWEIMKSGMTLMQSLLCGFVPLCESNFVAAEGRAGSIGVRLRLHCLCVSASLRETEIRVRPRKSASNKGLERARIPRGQASFY